MNSLKEKKVNEQRDTEYDNETITNTIPIMANSENKSTYSEPNKHFVLGYN